MKVRVKVRNRLLRRGGAAAGVVLGLAALLWISGQTVRSARSFVEGRLLSFRPVSITMDCPPPVADSARELLAGAVGHVLSGRRCGELAAELKSRHSALASARISRNFFTGKARVTAAPEPAAAAVLLNGTTAYLGESGRFMDENLSGPVTSSFSTEVAGSTVPAPGLVKFIKEVEGYRALFACQPVKLSCASGGASCSFLLSDGSNVTWGGFEFTRLKIIRLSEVMRKAAGSRSGPFKVDLRSFAEGKIFVSPVK